MCFVPYWLICLTALIIPLRQSNVDGEVRSLRKNIGAIKSNVATLRGYYQRIDGDGRMASQAALRAVQTAMQQLKSFEEELQVRDESWKERESKMDTLQVGFFVWNYLIFLFSNCHF